MSGDWLQIVLATRIERADEAEALLQTLGAVSITVEDAADQPIFEPPPGETPIWTQLLITGLFSDAIDLATLSNRVRAKCPAGIALVTAGILADRPWEREWMSRFEPMRFGQRLWICPTWCQAPAEAKCILNLDPGLAFGTGTHETTALCLEWLDSADIQDRDVIDYGCGSGVLGIAALILGCRSVLAIDNDPQALLATRQNAEQNQVAERLQERLPPMAPDKKADVLLANILAEPLIALAMDLSGALRPGGQIVLSGILTEQVEQVASAYTSNIEWQNPTTRGDWARLSGVRREA